MKKIRIYLYLALFLLGINLFALHNMEVQAEETFSSMESYTTRSFKGLEMTIDDPAKISIEDRDDGIMVTGSSDDLNDVTFTIDKLFHFEGNRVGRVALNALAAKGQNLKLALYRDDESASFAEISILNQTSASSWTRNITLHTDILDQDIQGDHKIFFKILSEDAGEVAILLRSIEFVESDLPTIYLNIDESLGYVADMNSSSDHTDECYGKMDLQIPKGYTYEYGDHSGTSTTMDETITYDLSFLRGRGNSTWASDKKPYRIKLEKKADILGMGKEKKWALVANRFDNTKLRNKITYWLGEELGIPYTPSSVPVDVVVNGVYFGSYFLSETIRVGENRVDIENLEESEETKTSTDPQLITGGYFLSYDSWGTDDEQLRFETEHGFKLAIESPSFDGYTNDAQFNYIKDYVQKTEDALYGEDFKDDEGHSWTEYMDLDSAVDYYLAEEFTMNADGYKSGSNYLYKNRDGKLCWGPWWDFDFGYNCDKRFENLNKWIHSTDKTWVNQMLKDPVFHKRLVERWPVFREKLQEASKDDGQIDQYYEHLLISERYDMERWGFIGPSSVSYAVIPFSTFENGSANFKKAKETLKSFIKTRIEWFDSNMTEDQYCKLTFMVDGETYKTNDCICNSPVYNIPDGPEKEGCYFDGWIVCDENGKEGTQYLTSGFVLTEDTFVKASYIDKNEKAEPEEIYLSRKEIAVNVDANKKCKVKLYASVYPENHYGQIQYSSDDPEMASVDQDGNITINNKASLASVIITVSCGSLSDTCQIIINNPEDTSWEIPKSDFSLDQTSLSLNVGEIGRINVSYDEFRPVYEDMQWISLDDTIATVDQCGVVKGVMGGSTTIYLADASGENVQECQVTVKGSSSNERSVQNITVKSKKKTIRYKTLKKKSITYNLHASAKTELIYQKLKGNKKISVSRTGKIKVNKKLRKGTYHVKVKIIAKASKDYLAATKTLRLTIKVK